MTVRKQIIDSLVNTLALIKRENGYNVDIASVSKKFKEMDEVITPAVFVSLGEETRSQPRDEQFAYDCNLDAFLLISVQVDTDAAEEGSLSDTIEDIVEDIDNHLEHTHISPAYCSTLNQIPEMQNYGISKIDPILDDESNRTYLLITISITYLKQE